MAVGLAPSIAAWLRRAAADDRLAVRGSVVLAALSDRARAPLDVDHLLIGDATLADAEARLRAIAGDWPVTKVEVLWPDSPAPGVRAQVAVAGAELQVDVAIREPLEAAPHPRELPGVGPVTCAAIEDLCAWKIHGLVEFGHGQWRPKDLYDLDVIAELALDRALVRRAVESAFASRAAQVPMLDDFLDRATWGESASGRRRWRTFARDVPGAGEFPPLRDRVRAFVRAIVRV